MDKHTQTDAGNGNTRKPKLASGKKGKWNQSKLVDLNLTISMLMSMITKGTKVGQLGTFSK